MVSGGSSAGGFTLKRLAILIGLFFANLPAWVVGIYLILKWSGQIRGMSPRTEAAFFYAVVALYAALPVGLAVAVIAAPPGTTSYQLGADAAVPFVITAALMCIGTFYAVRRLGPPSFLNVDWPGFWLGVLVAGVGVTASISSYSAAAGGGRFLVLWGAVVWGGWRVLTSLSRPPKGSVVPEPKDPGTAGGN